MRVLLGMSGGVDSATAALLLRNAGHEVTGAFMIMHSDRELTAARASADMLGIPLITIDCREEFEKEVKAVFAEEYMSGRTPNPCVICNERVKMRILWETAKEYGFDAVASGHYAQVVRTDKGYCIARAADFAKDQSYMLYRVGQQVLEHLILPLAHLTKSEVRKIASERGIPAAEKGDSMEICFIEQGDYADFLESRYGSLAEGDFLDTDGRVIGKHRGFARYTVGQRKGLGISLGRRAFVTAVDPVANTVTLDSAPVLDTSVRLCSVVCSGAGALHTGDELAGFVMLRYSSRLIPCNVCVSAEDEITVTLAEGALAAPGQSAVVYDGQGRVLLGGFITR